MTTRATAAAGQKLGAADKGEELGAGWLGNHQVDAFTGRPFAGNPAGICPLDTWLPDRVMQAVAAENAVAETAFFVRRPDGDFDLRWFTPEVEVDLCGHATLASAFFLFDRLEPDRRHVRFHTRSGPLEVERDGAALVMDLPARPPTPAGDGALAALERALGRRPIAALRARDLLAVFESAADVRALRPDMAAIAALDTFAVIASGPGTAPDDDVDFVSRFFAPAKGVAEDPVTGSAHCTLVPYWAERLGRPALRARQVSRRGGELRCELRGERVRIAGQAVLVKTGAIFIGDGT
ncbi:MAG TPA: PhzF family phenazine biosynthesis protein [Kofleriaceae bacterium]|nr:PhzF family phenazine biosynthesis protein [Kofleriaceae bacterium]